MLLRIANMLNPHRCALVRERLEGAGDAWVDGRATAGHQGAQVKRNLQLAEDAPIARELGSVVVARAGAPSAVPERCACPRASIRRCSIATTAPTGCNSAPTSTARCGSCPAPAIKIRTDVAATLFLSAPETYDGGELVIEDTYGTQAVKLPAGDMVLYPATSRHRVMPVTRGVRLASFFWVQSMVRDDAQRALLFDLDMAIVRLDARGAGSCRLVDLTGCYHNLLRMWAEVVAMRDATMSDERPPVVAAGAARPTCAGLGCRSISGWG